ncbi:MAG: serine/threonine protein kinase [Coriobacteriales bacterium]|jgi:hypothetical protein|nr:serine/threonine protein kinase [Coriobacteriales bacterium]
MASVPVDSDTQEEAGAASDLILGRYKPLFLRARGGFSSVEVAWDTRLQRRVAIKRIAFEALGDSAGIAEARTAALLSHARIVAVYDVHRTATETLIIMENIEGPSLFELLAGATELLGQDEIAAIVDGVVQALEYAHENQVLHLDIKPANILIDQSGQIKVSDFGLAELAGAAGFAEVLGGTIGYMPPEQLELKTVDERSDLWALAALCYQLLTGENPFFAVSPQASLAHIIHEPVALPSALRPELSADIDATLIEALSADPAGRPCSVVAFWANLHPFLGKVGVGRRRLKSLAQKWVGDTTTPPNQPEGAKATDELVANGVHAAANDERGSQQNTLAVAAGDAAFDAQALTNSVEVSTRDRRDRAGQDRRQAAPKNSTPLWQRASKRVQAAIARAFCALGCASMAWLGLSSVPFIGSPLGSLAASIATNSGQAVLAQSELTLAISLLGSLLAAMLGFILPSAGTALAGALLALGFYFTGNWLVGNLVLVAFIPWWLTTGRRSMADSCVLLLTPLLCLAQLPVLLPLLAGYFQGRFRALATTALAFLLACLISLLSIEGPLSFWTALGGQPQLAGYGQFSSQYGFVFLGGSLSLAHMPASDALWIPLATLITSPAFWIMGAGWLAASWLLSLLTSSQSRVKYAIGSFLAVLLLASISLMVPLLEGLAPSDVSALLIGPEPSMRSELLAGLAPWTAYTIAVVAKLALSLAICLLLIAVGVKPLPEQQGTRKEVGR